MLDRITNGRTDLIFDYLLAGNDARATDGDGVSLIRWSAYFGDVNAIRFLLSRGEALASLGENFDLNGAAFHGHWKLCQFLLEQGADANFRLPDTGETPLHAATSVANRPAHDWVVKLLLGAGADPDLATRPGVETGCFMRDCRTKGETALHRAAAFGSEQMIAWLIEAGATVEARDAHGDTPLSWASWHQRPAAVLRRLSHGDYFIHPEADWTGDHGNGWRGMDKHLLGEPRS